MAEVYKNPRMYTYQLEYGNDTAFNFEQGTVINLMLPDKTISITLKREKENGQTLQMVARVNKHKPIPRNSRPPMQNPGKSTRLVVIGGRED